MKEEISSLKATFGKKITERLLSFAMMRWAYHPETYSKAGFDEKLHCFGTLIVVYKVEKQEETKKSKTGNSKK